MKVLVTGANGFVGEAICRILAENNYPLVRVGGRQSSKTFKDLQRTAEMNVSVDITDVRSVSELERYRDFSIIIHCAGLAHRRGNVAKKEFFKVNVEGTANIAKLAAKLKIKKLILMSSVAVYGTPQASDQAGSFGDHEKSLCRPKDFYAESKLAGELEAVSICRRANLNLTILRPATVVGAGDAGNFFRLIKAVYRRRFVWIGDGENRKSIIYKDDLGRACLEIIRQNKNESEIFNISAEPIKVREIMEVLNESLHRNCRPSLLSEDLLRGLSRFNEKNLKLKLIRKFSQTLEKWLADDLYPAVKFEKIYGFSPSISAREALRRECAWFLKK